MAERRSLSSALDLTPEKMAFIQGGGSASPKAAPKPRERVVQAPEPLVVDERVEAIRLEADEEVEELPRESRPRRPARPRSRPAPEPTPITDYLLVPITTRLNPRTADALRRAHLEQKLRRQSPSTQQEIVEEALQEWLRDNGYLN
jgi:hypothetical protein